MSYTALVVLYTGWSVKAEEDRCPLYWGGVAVPDLEVQ